MEIAKHKNEPTKYPGLFAIILAVCLKKTQLSPGEHNRIPRLYNVASTMSAYNLKIQSYVRQVENKIP